MLSQTIKGHKIEIEDNERQPCEVWTRVMGYYRPVSEFNIGKKAEHNDRKFFTETQIETHVNEYANENDQFENGQPLLKETA